MADARFGVGHAPSETQSNAMKTCNTQKAAKTFGERRREIARLQLQTNLNRIHDK